MGLACVSGTADPRHNFAAPDVVSCLYAHAARLEVEIVRELSAAQVERDAVTANRFERDRDGRTKCLEVAGVVVGKAIPCCQDRTARDGKHGLPIGVIRAALAVIAGE